MNLIGRFKGDIYGYKKKMSSVKYIGMGASGLLLVMFHPFSIVLGIVYLLFNVDQSYILSIVSILKKIGKKINKYDKGMWFLCIR